MLLMFMLPCFAFLINLAFADSFHLLRLNWILKVAIFLLSPKAHPPPHHHHPPTRTHPTLSFLARYCNFHSPPLLSAFVIAFIWKNCIFYLLCTSSLLLKIRFSLRGKGKENFNLHCRGKFLPSKIKNVLILGWALIMCTYCKYGQTKICRN